MHRSIALARRGFARDLARRTAAPSRQAAPAAAAPQSEAERLKRLFHESDEANLRRNPGRRHLPRRPSLRRPARRLHHRRLFRRGERRRRGRSRRASGDRPLEAQRHRPDRLRRLRMADRESLKNLEPEMLALGVVLPINHCRGFHTFYPTFASGEGAAPFKTVADYENNLKRHRIMSSFTTGRSAASARAWPRACSRPS